MQEVGVAPSRHETRFRPAHALPVLSAVALATLAVAITLVATRNGPLLSPDSVTYASLTRNLTAGRGYVDLTGQPNTTFAPGLPVLLTSAQWLGITIADASRLVNVVSFAAVVAMAWWMLRRHTRSRAASVIGAALVVVSPAMLDVADHLWSELAFSFVVLAFIVVLEEGARRVGDGSGLRWYAAAGILAGVACLIRYAGFPLVVVGVVCAAATPGDARHRARRALVFLATALPLPLLWTARNATSGARYLLGPRVASRLDLAQIVRGFLRTSVDMFVRGIAPVDRTWWAVVIAAGVLLVALLTHARRPADGRAAGQLDGRPTVVALLGFVVVYSVTVVVSGKAAGSSVDSRILMPLVVPLVVLGARVACDAGTAIRSTGAVWSRPVLVACSCVAAIGLVVIGDRTVRTAWEAGRAPHGYATDTLAVSPLARAVRARVEPDELVATNSPWTLYSATGHVPIDPAPGPLYPSASLVPLTTARLTAEACRHHVYFAWYWRGKPVPPDLSPEFGLRTVASGTDGALYLVSPSASRCSGGRGTATS